jgi:MoaA/NifB/PqqE/SkfB family radical SAM enzyme
MNSNNLDHTAENYGLREGFTEFPMMVAINFVYPCNAECPHCPYTNSNIRDTYKDQPFMDGKTFKLIADECGKYNAWLRMSGGGEPMLHPQAVELAQYAKKAGAKVGLLSNGSKYNEKNSLQLLRAGVDMIEFSVDAGDRETYAWARKGLDWDTLLENIKRMVRLRNELQAPTKIIASGIIQKGVDIDAVESFWLPLVDNFQKRKFLTWGINDSSNSSDPMPYLEPDENIPCPYLFERLFIDGRGKAAFCPYDISASTGMGNVNDMSIAEIWTGKDFQSYRSKHLTGKADDIEMCKNCPDRKYRSWNHNYFKLVENAAVGREQKVKD